MYFGRLFYCYYDYDYLFSPFRDDKRVFMMDAAYSYEHRYVYFHLSLWHLLIAYVENIEVRARAYVNLTRGLLSVRSFNRLITF